MSNVKCQMFMGKDRAKDQSYFLWTLGQYELAHTLFPVGHLEKTEVRKLAKKFVLPNAERKESQGVCFLGEFNMKDFLKHYMKEKRGDVLDEKGNVLGFHEGAVFYTLGERHGFTITKKTPNDPPLFVIAKDVQKNTLVVSPHKVSETKPGKTVYIRDVHFVSGKAPIMNRVYSARVRYRQPLQSCWIEAQIIADKKQINADNDVDKMQINADNDVDTSRGKHLRKSASLSAKICVRFNAPQIAAPGQSLVLYDGKSCLGGGIIC